MRSLILLAAATAGLAGSASANNNVVNVNSNIAVSTTWTANNCYNLQQQIYVLPGATLTIQAGTIVASTTGVGGSLAVTRGAQIIVQGTKAAPVIMTSTSDTATWTNNNPKTGIWRLSANEWGNLTVMGDAFISEDAVPGNVPTCNANNEAIMEGLIEAFPGDPNVRYGGGNDDDDSGSISHLSIRYGGRVIGLNNELNGLSLGGIGRGTDIDHVEIMNNVDDGIEIWGGCVNLKYFAIMFVGDDSLDLDQGWRGKAQYGLIVQGASLDAPQGSGVGDNSIEIDGAENSDWQPVTTTTLYNMTIIGQRLAGDGATAWRDNARMQLRKSIIMDCGERVVRFDNVDGDGGQGYGHNGTLSWLATWQTAWNAAPAHPNDCPPGTYKAQQDGNLCEITDTVFYRNLASDAYTNSNGATAVGVWPPSAANANVDAAAGLSQAQQLADVNMPIKALQWGAPQLTGGLQILPLISFDPRAANDALVCTNATVQDDFFDAVDYRGAFSCDENWMKLWTATDAYGFFSEVPPGAYCVAKTSSGGCTASIGSSDPSNAPSSGANDYDVIASGVQGIKTGLLFGGLNPATIPFGGGTLCVQPPTKRGPLVFSGGSGPLACDGSFSTRINNGAVLPAGLDGGPGGTLFYQYWYRDPQGGMGNLGTALSDGLCVVFLP